MTGFKSLFRGALRARGFDFVRKTLSKEERLAQLIGTLGFSDVLDVGANQGQFAAALRQGGYAGTIASFEPLSQAYGILSERSTNDPHWTAYNYAVGATNSLSTLNVASGGGAASSFLKMTEFTKDIAASHGDQVEEVTIITLEHYLTQTPITDIAQTLLKIDVQGFEPDVLDGAGDLLDKFGLILLEASYFTLYHGETLADEIVLRLADKGFRQIGVYPEFYAEMGVTLQADLLFANPATYVAIKARLDG